MIAYLQHSIPCWSESSRRNKHPQHDVVDVRHGVQWRNTMLSAVLVICLLPLLCESFTNNNGYNNNRVGRITSITSDKKGRHKIRKNKKQYRPHHHYSERCSITSSATRSSSENNSAKVVKNDNELDSSSSSSSSSSIPQQITKLNGKTILTSPSQAINNNNNGHHQPSKLLTNNKVNNNVNQNNQRVDIKLTKTSDTNKNKQWKRRHARSVQEGIRRETTRKRLSTILSQAKKQYNRVGGTSETKNMAILEEEDDEAQDSTNTNTNKKNGKKRYAARTISGLITALAEEAEGLEVDVEARKDTPLWGKHVEEIRLNFSRLGFKPLRISGLKTEVERESLFLDTDDDDDGFKLSAVSCADEAFDRIDVDNSGALDIQEIATALKGASAATSDDKLLLEGLASELVELYDVNGDGVVDREEYQSMVEDMAAVREAQEVDKRRNFMKGGGKKERPDTKNNSKGWFGKIVQSIPFVKGSNATKIANNDDDADTQIELESLPKGEGSIVLSDLKLDLRRLVFGGLPILKKITPGGPLILEPFTMTVTGSFNSKDVMESFIIDANLRRLVARVLRLRVRSLRDFVDGAVFYGRTWKQASKTAPVVEVPKLTKVEFDAQDRMILTGRALVRTSLDAPMVEQAFKVRCRIGTRGGGRYIRLVEPELALVIECPQSWEEGVAEACDALNLPVPDRPEPIYSFFPIYSPFKLEDKGGFYLGEDNCIKAIYIKDGALRFEMSAVLRPGRFLGNHYVAFNVPQRTFIVTMDRVKEGMREARKNKREAMAARRKQRDDVYREVQLQTLSSDNRLNKGQQSDSTGLMDPQESPAPTKSFFSRFVQGYLNAQTSTSSAEEEAKAVGERTERLTTAISDWFGRQGGNSAVENESDQEGK